MGGFARDPVHRMFKIDRPMHRFYKFIQLLWLGILVCAAFPLGATEYYVDPASVGAGGTGQGSATAPWTDLEAAFASGQLRGGDTLYLAAGAYGGMRLSGVHFDPPLAVQGPGHEGPQAHFSWLELQRVSGLALTGLAFWPQGSTPRKKNLLLASPESHNLHFSDFEFRGDKAAEQYPSWSKADWLNRKVNGALLRGADIVMQESRFTGLYISLAATGARAKLLGNQISGFSGDAIRVLGDHSRVAGNQIRDCVQVDGNHADGIQSWSLGEDRRPGTGVVTGLQIQSNVIIEWVEQGPSRTRPAFGCSLQGIGFFDGMFQDTQIENNVIQVSAFHGITIAGGLNTWIRHNTVLHIREPGNRKRPWISLRPHKDGHPSVGGVVVNNIAVRMPHDDSTDQSQIYMAGNHWSSYPARDLVAPYAGRFAPKPGSSIIDVGDKRHALPTDLFGRPRVVPDIGAIEAFP